MQHVYIYINYIRPCDQGGLESDEKQAGTDGSNKTGVDVESATVSDPQLFVSIYGFLLLFSCTYYGPCT